MNELYLLLVLEKNDPLRKETTVQKYNKKHLVIQKIPNPHNLFAGNIPNPHFFEGDRPPELTD